MLKRLWLFVRDRVFGLLHLLDQAVNVLWGKDEGIHEAGRPQHTVSQRLARMREKGSKTACVFCKVLTWIARRLGEKTNDHCGDALKED